MKIQSNSHQGVDIPFLNIKEQALHYSVQNLHSGSSNSVFNHTIIENENPGPGRYKDVNNLSDRGHYTISKSTGYGKRIFSKERRIAEF